MLCIGQTDTQQCWDHAVSQLLALQGSFDGTIVSTGNPAWDGSSPATCTEPLVNITSGPSGPIAVRNAVFTFAAPKGRESSQWSSCRSGLGEYTDCHDSCLLQW